MENKDEINNLAREFEACKNILVALGDETRQHLILEMIKIGNCSGVRVGDIQKVSHLSRPAISHHLQILKNAGILKMRREATKNYYYFDPNTESIDRLIGVLQKSKEIIIKLPDRSEL